MGENKTISLNVNYFDCEVSQGTAGDNSRTQGERYHRQHQAFAPVFGFPSVDKQKIISKGPFDLVFIDGDHRYPAVLNDTKKAFDLLKNKNSIIVWHDYAASPNELRYEVMLGILDGSPTWAHQHIYKVSNSLCAIYYPFEIKSKPFNYPGEVTKTFKVTIS